MITITRDTYLTPSPYGSKTYVGVEATGTNLTYQWKKSTNNGETWVNSTDTGATTNECNFTMNSKTDRILMKCILTDSDESIESSAIMIEPTIRLITAPKDCYQQINNNAIFKIVVEDVLGSVKAIQWQYSDKDTTSWINITSESGKTPKLVINASEGYMYKYRCRINDNSGKALYTNVVFLHIIPSLTELFTSVADAIRTKKGTTDKIVATDFSTEINNIPALDTSIEDSLVDGSVVHYRNDRLTTIGASAFHARANLLSAIFENVETVTQNAFYRAPNLETVVFGKAKTIGQNTFYQCGNLKSVIIKSDEVCTLQNANAFSVSTGISKGNGYVYFPQTLIENYKTKTNWTTFANQFRAIEDWEERIDIINQPASVEVAVGDAISFTTGADGMGLFYQWQTSRDGGLTWTNNSGKTDTYETIAKDTYNGWKLRCIITNYSGFSIISDEATVTVV